LFRRLTADSGKRNIDSCCVTCCSIKNVIVASELYDVAVVQFTAESRLIVEKSRLSLNLAESRLSHRE